MKKILVNILLITLSQIAYSQELDSVKIKGTVFNATGKTIKIGDNTVPVSENGSFVYTAKIRFPNLIDISYDNLNWAIYLEPFKTVEFDIKSGDLSSLIYKDDLKVSNEFLKDVSILNINTEINEFFNKNWGQIHSQKEPKFISIIDSLKQLFLQPLATYQNENKNISIDFVKLFKADVNFGFNSVILRYPELHQRFTGEKVGLSQVCRDYLN